MPDLMTSFLIGAALFGAFLFIRSMLEDKALDDELAALELRARITLPPETLQRLQGQLNELDLAGFVATRKGLAPKAATKAVKRAAIQTIIAFMEIDRMFMPSVQPEEPAVPPQLNNNDLNVRSAALEHRMASFQQKRGSAGGQSEAH